MRLNKPSLPVRVSAKEITEQVKGLLEEKGWRDYEIQRPVLWFFPYWVFNFNSFSESLNESGMKSTSEGEQGTTALHGQSAELEDAISELFNEFESELMKKLEEKDFRLERFRIQRHEAERLAQLKVAARLGIDKENVVVSGLRQIFFPVWRCTATFEGQSLEFHVGATGGNLLSEEEVPERGQTIGELAGETVFDLKNPVNWLQYLFDIVRGILSFLWGNPLSAWLRGQLLSNRTVQIVVLAFIVLLILLNEFGWI